MNVTELFEEKAIRGSPRKSFENGQQSTVSTLLPCDVCARKFSDVNLARHIIICQKLSEKPRRAAFHAIAQRLSHVAQEASVRPVIQRMLLEEVIQPAITTKRHVTEVLPGLKDPEHPAPTPRNSTNFRLGHRGTDLYKETQRGLSECPCCKRSFLEKAFERHVDFCKQQQVAKERHVETIDAAARTELLLRRVKYRPPVLKLPGKQQYAGESRKAVVSSFGESTPSAVIPTHALGSKSALSAVNTPASHTSGSVRGGTQPEGRRRRKLSSEAIREPQKPPLQSDKSVNKASTSQSKTKKHSQPPLLPKSVLHSAGDSMRLPELHHGSKDAPDDLSRLKVRHDTVKKSEQVLQPSELVADVFLIPALNRIPVGVADRQRLFERIGGSYKVKYVDKPIKISEFVRMPCSHPNYGIHSV